MWIYILFAARGLFVFWWLCGTYRRSREINVAFWRWLLCYNSMATDFGFGRRRMGSSLTHVFGLFSGKMGRILMVPMVLRRSG
jgi:hypothetical protein